MLGSWACDFCCSSKEYLNLVLESIVHSVSQVFVSACRSLGNTSLGRDKDAIQTTITLSNIIKQLDMPEGPNHPKDLYALLWTFHRNGCSKEKDRIAALYGFLPRNLQLQVDFMASYQDI